MKKFDISKIIPFDPNYNFEFLEDKDICNDHPASEYYLKLNDLSVNLELSLKWIAWGYIFLENLSDGLKKIDDRGLTKLIDKAIQSNFEDAQEEKHELLVDGNIVSSSEKFDELLLNQYNHEIFHENTKVHLKLKINLNEYLIISNTLFPTFLKYE